ncbi:hypothetical protein D0Z00_004393 [Geotrichum galactomycetum]|uniref:Uncharacterized protein n=1 Tax=Geotrichum galactomycetum TaxID=27317 RepID=A0ACB6UYL4_9ASCO|nr:hypothetical protein D0Z00_004393 [Geotrichum candidum]
MSNQISVPDPNLYVFDLIEKLRNSITPFTFSSPKDDEELSLQVQQEEKQNKKQETTDTHGKVCSYCGTIPETGEANYLQLHYKKDYHRYNIKRKLHNLAPFSEQEFEKAIGDMDNESISGSDSDESDESDAEDKQEEDSEHKLTALLNKTDLADSSEDNGTDEPVTLNHTPFFMYNSKDLEDEKVYAIYKNLFDSKYVSNGYKSPEEEYKNNLAALESLDPNGTSAILMLGGGHFSGGIIKHKRLAKQKPNLSNPFVDIEVVVSKTFHRYTTRRKQGGAQSTSDSQRGKANSAGSSLRRANEAALEKEIRELLDEWRGHLDNVSSIYIRANGPTNKSILVNYPNAPISGKDPRIKSVPFTTKRATASEIKRVWAELSHVKVQAKPKIVKKKVTGSRPQSATTSVANTKQQQDPNEVHTKELTALIKKSKIALFIAYIKKNKININEFQLVPATQYSNTPTLLHYAAAKGAHNMIQTFLKPLKASPAVTNAAGKTPYQTAGDRATRDAFQLLRSALGEGPHAWGSWDADARVGRALTSDDIKARAQRESAEKAQDHADRIQEMERQEEARVQHRIDRNFPITSTGRKVLSSSVAVSTSGKTNLLEMTPEERRKFEREQRALAIEARLGIKK